MIENLLAIAIFAGLLAAVYKTTRYLLKRQELKEQQRQFELEAEVRAARERAQLRQAADTARKMLAASNKPPRKETASTVPPRGKETTVSYAQSPTQSVSSYQDNFLSDIATAMVVNTLLASTHNSQSGVVTEDRDTGKVEVKVKESSWGFDDSDSRKSISSSMDTSSSYSSDSSSSSSYDSGSSSGPSSDW